MIRKFMLAKLVGFLLVGHVAAQVSSNVYELAHAIAHAEGYYTKGTIPSRCHNPGDLKAAAGMTYPGQVGVCKGGHIRFRRDADGWSALRRQIEKALSGESHFYNPRMTFRSVAKKYAQDSRIWLKNVTHNLGDVSPDMTLAEYFDLGRTNYVAQESDIDFMNFDFLAEAK